MSAESDFRQERNAILRGETAMLKNTRDEIVQLLKEADERIRVILAGQPTDYQQWALPRLQREIQQTLARFGEGAAVQISNAAGQAWEMGEQSILEPLRAGGALTQGASFQSIDPRQLLAMRAFATERIKNIAIEAANKINSELGRVVIGAQGPSDAITAIKGILGAESRARATTIVRTSLGQVFSVAAHERIGGVAAKVPGLKKQWHQSGKLHPRPHHAAADGQVQEVNEPFMLYPAGKARVELMFPLDPAAPASEVINCGCRMTAFKADWVIDRPPRVPRVLANAPSLREILAQRTKLAEAFDPRQPRDEKGRWTATGASSGNLAGKAQRKPARVSHQALIDFAARAKSAKNVHEKLALGRVPNADAIERATGIQTSGYGHQLDNFGIKHALKYHGAERTEGPREQRPITAADVTKIWPTVRSPDRITHGGRTPQGREVIQFEKRFGEETLHYRAEVRTKRRELATLTFFVKVPEK